MISVIIPTHSPNLDFLRQTLESLRKQTYKDFTVTVVENPIKTNEVANLIKQYGYFHIESDPGANKARNTGVAHSNSADIVVFLDDDVIASTNLLEKYNSAHSLYPAGVIGGPVHLRYLDGKPRWINKHFEGYLAKLDNGFPFGSMPFELKKEWDLHVPLVSANLSFRKSVFNTLKGFDEDEGYVGKSLMAPNDELGLLTRCEKYKNPGMVYIPDAYVTHLIPKERTCEDYLVRRMYGQGIADFRSFKKLYPRLTSLEVYEKIILEHNSLVINDVASFYCLFKDMSRVNRLYATKVYHKGRVEYSRGILSQVEL